MSGSLFPRPLTVRRVAEAGYVNGMWTEGDDPTLSIQGSAQPITGRETEPAEVGRMDKGRIVIRTDAELHVSEEGGTTKDFVHWDGREWEVMTRRQYDGGILPHIEYEAEYRKALP